MNVIMLEVRFHVVKMMQKDNVKNQYSLRGVGGGTSGLVELKHLNEGNIL